MVALVSLLGGCDTFVAPVPVVTPDAHWGAWMVAALNDQGRLVGVGVFDVDQFGNIQMVQSEVFVTGQGTWQVSESGIPVENGTFLVWRANGGAYAGVGDLTVAGSANGTGSGSTATGNWRGSVGPGGAWTATKQ